MKCYRDYLASQAEEEKKKEKELDALLNEEIQKQWAKRVNQWRMEREARKKLLQNVLETRKKQIQEKCEGTCFVTNVRLIATFGPFHTCNEKLFQTKLFQTHRFAGSCWTHLRVYMLVFTLHFPYNFQ